MPLSAVTRARERARRAMGASDPHQILVATDLDMDEQETDLSP